MDWTAGYASDVEYTAGFYNEQSTTHLNFACILNGFEPPRMDGAGTYFELGFGRGLTALVLAASNPNARFYAADFNPAHVAGARDIAGSAGLQNLTLLEDSFEQLANGSVPDLPQFDYITLHGIYSWVTAENRQHIVRFIGRYLKPGGLVYLSYNAMPGWAAMLPLQRFLVDYGDAFPNRSDVQLSGALTVLRRFEALQAGYFMANPLAKQRLERIGKENANYLVHEYMHRHWQPLYHADVARDLAEAKLEFAASADLVFAFPSVCLNQERRDLLATMPDPTLRETMRDYFLNIDFRKDIFVRGARRISIARQEELLLGLEVYLLVPQADLNFQLKTSIGEMPGNPEVYGPVCDVLAQQPCTVNQLLTASGLNMSAATVVQVVTMLVNSGQAVVAFPHAEAPPAEAARSLNRVLAGRLRYGEEFAVLASPVTGSGIRAGSVDRILYPALAQAEMPDRAPLKHALETQLAKLGRKLAKDGVELSGDALQAELDRQITSLLETKLPLWKNLGIL